VSAGIVLGWRLGFSRLAPRRLVVLTLLAAAVTAVVASVERSSGSLHAPSTTLATLFGLVVPLLSVGVVSLASGGERLDLGAWSVARFGWARGEIALGALLMPALTSVLIALATTALGLAIAYGDRPGLAADLRLTLPIAALGSAAYFGFLALGAAFLPRGRGRWLALGLDLVFGATAGPFAVPFPRGHLRNLLGGESVLELSQRASSAALLGIAALGLVLAVQRAGR
jgi:hypothetical protein